MRPSNQILNNKFSQNEKMNAIFTTVRTKSMGRRTCKTQKIADNGMHIDNISATIYMDIGRWV